MSPLVLTRFESCTCTGCARGCGRCVSRASLQNSSDLPEARARQVFKATLGWIPAFVNALKLPEVFLEMYFLIKPEESPPASSKED